MSMSDHLMTTKNIDTDQSTLSLQDYYNYTFEGEQLSPKQHAGTHKWHTSGNIQKYTGFFFCNNLHGKGIYTQIRTQSSSMYEGYFYANNFEGYATVTYNNCTCFEGLFKDNSRFGPGVLTHARGQQDVGIWEGHCLIRLSRVVLENWVPKLGNTSLGKANVLKYRKVVPLVSMERSFKLSSIVKATSQVFDYNKLYNDNIRDPNSKFFNRDEYDKLYFQDEQYIEIVEDDDLPKNEVLNPHKSAIQEEVDEAELIAGSEAFQFSKYSEGKGEEEEAPYAEDTLCPEELELFKIKFAALDTLGREPKVPSKKVGVTDLLAWNNEDIFIEILKHTFLHRSHEHVVGFDVGKLLAGVRKDFGVPGEIECACVAFLTACSEDSEEQVYALYEDFKLNPDLCDARGNTGIMYAACRDRINIIRLLVEIGGNLDAWNDECMTPLGICLLRYLAVLYDIDNWEQGFVDYIEENAVADHQIFYSPTSFTNVIMHSVLNYVAHCNSAYIEDGSVLELFRIASNIYPQSDINRLFALLNLERPSPEAQDFQSQYEWREEAKTPYLFVNTFDFSKAEHNEEKQKKLEVIFNTIMTLLYYNADIAKCIQPRSALTLALYTKNEEMVAKILKAGADPNEQTKFLSPLHLLCTLQPDENWIKFLKLLLENGADPNARTLCIVYPEQVQIILGDADCEGEEDEKGISPLHILAIRHDYSEHIGKLAKVLIDNGAHLNTKFLGHTPLSLAVLKASIDLVSVLLDLGADPNEKLNCDLGNPLTIYALVRYAKHLPPIKTCMLIIDKLVQHFGNVLIPIYNYDNAIEFAMKQTVTTKPQKEVIEYLTTIARRTAYLHYQSKAVLKLFLMVIRREPQTPYFSDLAKLITMDDALRIIQLLINKNLVKLQNDMHYIALHFLLQYLSKNASAGKAKLKQLSTSPPDIAKLLNNLKTSGDTGSYKCNTFNEFELDNMEEIYIICYQCCFRTNKLLLPCPKCGEIYFCSQQCNKVARAHKLLHPCDLLFYDNKSLHSCPTNIKNNIKYYLSELNKALYEFENNRNVYEDLLMYFIVTQGQIINPFRVVSEENDKDKCTERNTTKWKDKLHGAQSLESRTNTTMSEKIGDRDLKAKSTRRPNTAAGEASKYKRVKDGLIQTSKDKKTKDGKSKDKETKDDGGRDIGLDNKTKYGEETDYKSKGKQVKVGGAKDNKLLNKTNDGLIPTSRDKKTKDGKSKDKKPKDGGARDIGLDNKIKDGEETGYKSKGKKPNKGGKGKNIELHNKTKEDEETGYKTKAKKAKEGGKDIKLHNKTKDTKETAYKNKGKKSKEGGGKGIEQHKKTKETGDTTHKTTGKKTKEGSRLHKKTKDEDSSRKSKKTIKADDNYNIQNKETREDKSKGKQNIGGENKWKNKKSVVKRTKMSQTDPSTSKPKLKKPRFHTSMFVKGTDMAFETIKKGENIDEEEEDEHRLLKPSYPLKRETFMRFHNFAMKMVDLFPDLDLLALMMPFVCFREGQLYYKFKDLKYYHTCMTYSSV